jgi:hypothetical protein
VFPSDYLSEITKDITKDVMLSGAKAEKRI